MLSLLIKEKIRGKYNNGYLETSSFLAFVLHFVVSKCIFSLIYALNVCVGTPGKKLKYFRLNGLGFFLTG